MKNKYFFVLSMLMAILLVSMGLTTVYVGSKNKKEGGDLVVVTSFYPMYIAALNIVGDTDNVELKNLSEPQTGCLHDFQLTPQDMKLLSKADVFIVNGGGIENFLTDVATAYPSIDIIEATRDVSLIEEDEKEEVEHVHQEGEVSHSDNEQEKSEVSHQENEEADHETESESADNEDTHENEHEHDLGEENAHAWMSISAYRIQVQTIAKALEGIDPDNASVYEKNAIAYDKKLAKLQEQQESLLEDLEDENIIIFHEAYEYLAQDYGMNVCYTLDLDEERQISAGEVADVVTAVKENGVKFIFAEELYGKSMGKTVQKETDVKVLYIDPLNRGEYDKDSYIKGMQKNIDVLKEAFSQKGD